MEPGKGILPIQSKYSALLTYLTFTAIKLIQLFPYESEAEEKETKFNYM